MSLGSGVRMTAVCHLNDVAGEILIEKVTFDKTLKEAKERAMRSWRKKLPEGGNSQCK